MFGSKFVLDVVVPVSTFLTSLGISKNSLKHIKYYRKSRNFLSLFPLLFKNGFYPERCLVFLALLKNIRE